MVKPHAPRNEAEGFNWLQNSIGSKSRPELEEFLWGDSFWADGYFVESMSKASGKSKKRWSVLIFAPSNVEAGPLPLKCRSILSRLVKEREPFFYINC